VTYQRKNSHLSKTCGYQPSLIMVCLKTAAS
jgi:hypothetical protein